MNIEHCNEILSEMENGFKISLAAFKIGEAAVLGMLYEVSTSPSPGLVSPCSTGAHRDMNFFTFLKSTASIAYCMYICAQIGIDYDKDILKKLRSVGIHGEKNMLVETGGVNTQRGLLFLAGVVCAAAGRCLKKHQEINRNNISKECSSICAGIIDNELKRIEDSKLLSNGERLYLKYGITGIRGEVEKGLPSIINVGLPLYEETIKLGFGENEVLSHTLLGLMAVVEDTTVINRCGIDGINLMKQMANRALELGGMRTARGREYVRQMDEVFKIKNISPGGAADLLAVTAMIYKLEKDFRSEV